MGKKITIYLAADLPRGTREIKIDQWSGKAICAPRNVLNEILSLSEVESGACIYFLIGTPDEGGLLNIYVGEADGFKKRVKHHDYKKDWWQEVAVFVSQDKSLTKTGAKYLESICIERLKNIAKCDLKNVKTPNMPTIPKEDISGLEIFYSNIAMTMPLLGYDIFVQTELARGVKGYPDLICRRGQNIIARGKLLGDGKMKVLKHSRAEVKETASFQSHPYKRLKDKLVKIGRLVLNGKTLIFVEDYIFDSPSAAAAVVQGRSASGPLEWKTAEGETLKKFLDKKISDN